MPEKTQNPRIFKVGFKHNKKSIHVYEPLNDKTNKMTYAFNKDSDQPGHPPSSITVFAGHLMDS